MPEAPTGDGGAGGGAGGGGGELQAHHRGTAIHHQLRAQNVAAFDEIGIEKIFDIGMIGVERTGLGISTNLIRRSKSNFFFI